MGTHYYDWTSGDLITAARMNAPWDSSGNLNIPTKTGAIGALTPSSLTMTNTVSKFSTDGTMAADSDSNVPTEKAVVTYVTNTNPQSFIKLTSLSSSMTGLTYTDTTGAFSATANYAIPLSADTGKGVTAYGWGNHASAGYFVGTSATILGLLSSSATGLTYNNSTGAFSWTTGYTGTHNDFTDTYKGYLNQNVQTTGTPQFAGVGVGVAGVSGIGLFGATASSSRYTHAKLTGSNGAAYGLDSTPMGVVGEAISGNGVGGYALSNGAAQGIGVYGTASPSNTGDTGTCYGSKVEASSAHSGGSNVAIWANAQQGATNYSFFGAAGDFYNGGTMRVALASVPAAANNSAAASAGVQIGGFYRTNADPSVLCIRSA